MGPSEDGGSACLVSFNSGASNISNTSFKMFQVRLRPLLLVALCKATLTPHVFLACKIVVYRRSTCMHVRWHMRRRNAAVSCSCRAPRPHFLSHPPTPLALYDADHTNTPEGGAGCAPAPAPVRRWIRDDAMRRITKAGPACAVYSLCVFERRFDVACSSCHPTHG